jgi:hypothetical protein
VNQEHAELVREMFSRYRAGQSQYEISKHLNAKRREAALLVPQPTLIYDPNTACGCDQRA